MPQSPLTEEQLELLSQQTEKAAVKAATRAVRAYRNRALAGFLILLIGIALSIGIRSHDAGEARTAIVVSTRNVAVDACNNRFRDRVVVRGIVAGGRVQIKRLVADGTLTPAEGKQSMADNRAALARLPLPDCRKARALITDDPSKLVPDRPKPLYPGHGDAQPFRYKPLG